MLYLYIKIWEIKKDNKKQNRIKPYKIGGLGTVLIIKTLYISKLWASLEMNTVKGDRRKNNSKSL